MAGSKWREDLVGEMAGRPCGAKWREECGDSESTSLFKPTTLPSEGWNEVTTVTMS